LWGVIVSARLSSGCVTLLFVCVPLVASCVALPPLTQATNNLPFAASIPIHDVVQRVKCDLTDALYAKIYQSRDPLKFAWMQNWTAKADLTLEINDTGGITPSVSYTKPLANGYVSGLGPNSINAATGATTNIISATAQNFTFGASGTFSGSVTRTETLSFNISMAELKEWKEDRQKQIARGQNLTGIYSCDPSAPTDVQAGLDLGAWLDESLKPVEFGDLRTGIHPTPTQAGAAPVASAPKPASSGPGGTKAIDESKNLPPPSITSPEEKAFLDLQLGTYLTALAVPYDLNDSAYYEPIDQTEKACAKSFKEPGKAVILRPPAYPTSNSPSGSSSNTQAQQSLVQQAIQNAQNAQSSAAEVNASQTLETQIKQNAVKAARYARDQAIRVQMASQYAAQHVLAECEADSTYIRRDKCISYQPAAGADSKATKLVLASPDSHVLVDTPVTLKATVLLKASGEAASGGSVSFKDDANATLPTVAPLQQGTATINMKFATPGTHSISATYSDDPNSTAVIARIVVVPNSSRTMLVTTPNPSDALSQVIFNATITGPGATPTGSVTFKVDGVSVNKKTLDDSGRAQFATSALGVGARSIVAEYGGSDSLASSVSDPIVQNVQSAPNPKSPTFDLWSSANPNAAGQIVTFIARVSTSGKGPAPTGYITFVETRDDGAMVPLHEPMLINRGEAQVSVESLAGSAMSHVIQAFYSGDKYFSSATRAVRQYVVPSLSGVKYVVVPLSPYYCDRQGYKDELKQLIARQVNLAELNADLAKQNATLASKYLTPDPPFQSIGQSLNFIVTVGASVSPSWSLVRWKGPSNGGTLASLTGVRTHSLNVAMGPVTGTEEVSRVLTNAATRQAIQGLQQ
jgi:hypothetical protein